VFLARDPRRGKTDSGKKTERGKKNHRGSKKKSHQDPRYVGITQDRNVPRGCQSMFITTNNPGSNRDEAVMYENGGIKKKRGNWGKRKGARECEGVCGTGQVQEGKFVDERDRESGGQRENANKRMGCKRSDGTFR
jgi:hypothetical protein